MAKSTKRRKHHRWALLKSRLAELGIVLPVAAPPAANYVPFVISGILLYVSGQLPFKDGKLAYSGRLGEALAVDDGYQAARLCGINLIAQMKAATGDWTASPGSSGWAVSSTVRRHSPISQR